MSNQGKWDKAIRAESEKLVELAGTFFTPDSMVAAFEAALQTRLVPLLDAAEDVRYFYSTGGRKTIRVLSQELDKWLTK